MIGRLFAALGLAMVLAASPVVASTPAASAIALPDEPEGIPLYGKDTPGKASSENWTQFMGRELVVRNVTRPTLTPYLPAPDKATGAAVIVSPGGGFMMLAMENEGWRVAKAFADRGIAAFVLKYRLLETPSADKDFMPFMMKAMSAGAAGIPSDPGTLDPAATEDGLAALAMVRARADEWGVDPDRVGMIGFSAGAIMALDTVLKGKPEQRPDFFGYIYGPQNEVAVPEDAPPMFDALAMDDPLFGNRGFGVANAWRAAKRPVELHAYEKGGHGFGLGRPDTTTPLMLDQFVAWMAMHGFLKQPQDK